MRCTTSTFLKGPFTINRTSSDLFYLVHFAYYSSSPFELSYIAMPQSTINLSLSRMLSLTLSPDFRGLSPHYTYVYKHTLQILLVESL